MAKTVRWICTYFAHLKKYQIEKKYKPSKEVVKIIAMCNFLDNVIKLRDVYVSSKGTPHLSFRLLMGGALKLNTFHSRGTMTYLLPVLLLDCWPRHECFGFLKRWLQKNTLCWPSNAHFSKSANIQWLALHFCLPIFKDSPELSFLEVCMAQKFWRLQWLLQFWFCIQIAGTISVFKALLRQNLNFLNSMTTTILNVQGKILIQWFSIC